MPRRALAEHRPWLLASLLAGVSYFFVKDAPFGETWLIPWKGAGVALLAAYALRRGRGAEAWLIALVMALGAIADMVLVLNMTVGGAIFAAGHFVAIGLYLWQRRPSPSWSQLATAAALLILTPIIAWALMAGTEGQIPVTAYGAVVGAMGAAAWLSRYSRYRTGLGAVLFVISDLLIFARTGGALPESVTGWLVWPLYYFGQFLIVTGVVSSTRHGHA